MPRQARKLSASGVYHITARGIDKQQIFCDDADNLTYLYFLDDVFASDADSELLAYCLMGNHVHLLVRTSKTSLKLLESLMKRIGVRYAKYYNLRYKRSGTLFESRFGSQPVLKTDYFLRALFYIHNNPVAAKIVQHPREYRWSSYRDYFDTNKAEKHCRASTQYALMIVPSLPVLEKMHHTKSKLDETLLEVTAPSYGVPDDEAKVIIFEISGCKTPEQFRALPTKTRDKYLKSILAEGLSQRQLSRLSGISRGVISRAVMQGV